MASLDRTDSRILAKEPLEAIAVLERQSEPRLIVLDEDGRRLRGLLCFNRSAKGFCIR